MTGEHTRIRYAQVFVLVSFHEAGEDGLHFRVLRERVLQRRIDVDNRIEGFDTNILRLEECLQSLNVLHRKTVVVAGVRRHFHPVPPEFERLARSALHFRSIARLGRRDLLGQREQIPVIHSCKQVVQRHIPLQSHLVVSNDVSVVTFPEHRFQQMFVNLHRYRLVGFGHNRCRRNRRIGLGRLGGNLVVETDIRPYDSHVIADHLGRKNGHAVYPQIGREQLEIRHCRKRDTGQRRRFHEVGRCVQFGIAAHGELLNLTQRR